MNKYKIIKFNKIKIRKMINNNKIIIFTPLIILIQYSI